MLIQENSVRGKTEFNEYFLFVFFCKPIKAGNSRIFGGERVRNIQIFLCVHLVVSFCGMWWHNNLENVNSNIPLALLLREKISLSSYCVTVCYLFVIYFEQQNFPCIFSIFVFQMEQELAGVSALNDGISKNYFHLNALSTWEMRIQYLLCHFPAHLWVIERDEKSNWIERNANCTRQINTSLERV